jgi:hypothetical protein
MDKVTIQPARYAKGMMAVHCPSDGSGLKTRAMRLCCALKARYSNREHCYIMSPSKAAKLERLMEGGWDAGFCSIEFIPPQTTLLF